MAVISKLNYKGKDITKYDNATISNINFNGVDYHFAKNTEVVGGYCENAVEEPIIDLKISGNSVQESENLFDKTKMLSGFLPQTGSYPVNNSSFPNALYQVIDIKSGQTFEITYTGSNASSGRIRYIDNDTNEVVGMVISETNEYYRSDSSYAAGFPSSGRIIALKDFKLGIMNLYPLASDFNLQIKSIVPTPETPIEIESVGKKTSNLFDTSKLEQGTIYDANGELSASATRIRTALILLEAGTYTLRVDTIQYFPFIRGIHIYDYDTEVWERYIAYNTREITFTLSRLSKIRFIFNTSDNRTITPEDVIKLNPILQIGESIVGSYEPYGYKIPVKSRGKNFINVNSMLKSDILVDNGDKSYSIGHTSNGRFSSKQAVNIPPNTPITISLELLEYTGSHYYPINFEITTEGGTKYINFRVQDKKITTTYNTTITKISIYFQVGNEIGTHAKFKNLMLEVGETATSYESYVEPATTNIYLNEPLRKIGNYADYLDYKNKKVVRNVANYILDGTTNKFSKKSGTTLNYIWMTDTIFKDVPNNTNLLCNYGKSSSVDEIFNHDKQGAYFENSRFKLGFGLNTNLTTLELANEWLLTNNVEVIYPLATPTDEIIDIPEIYTNDGTTIFQTGTSISPSEIKVDYWKQI
jgi:hypothetical protein